MGQDANAPYLLRADEGEALWFLGSLVTLKATGGQTRGQITVAEFVNPAGFAPPLHRHLAEDELFYVLSGAAEFRCAGRSLHAGAGDFVLLPVGLAHTFLVGQEEPLRALQITTPSGFEDFADAVGQPALRRELPQPGAVDPGALGHAAQQHAIELLGPPPLR
ncbi:cupin domain-containing protein [Pedococcus sp. NPDC057267]|uniref:cupin domain-containing protein n=1 Tax=Pedococcus sp. NPDC057267 TaxID=3346077 RepID=UPI00362AD430